MTEGGPSKRTDPTIEATKSPFIYRRLRMATVFISLILVFACALNDFGNRSVYAQNSVTTIQDEQNSNQGSITTFYIDGPIGSLVSDLLNPTIRENISSAPSIYVIAGNWSMSVMNGNANYFQVDFIMGLQDGTQIQVYSIENLRNIVPVSSSLAQNTAPSSPAATDQQLSNNLVLSSVNNYSLSLFGYVDVLTNDTIIWKNVPTSINIFNGNTISILLYPAETHNHFKGQPIFGIVTDILDANNNPLKPSIWGDT